MLQRYTAGDSNYSPGGTWVFKTNTSADISLFFFPNPTNISTYSKIIIIQINKYAHDYRRSLLFK